MLMPTTFPFYLETLHGFVPANQIFQSPGNYVMNAGHTIGAGWAFIKNKSIPAFPVINAFFKGFLFFPNSQNFFSNLREIQLTIFRIFLIHFSRLSKI